MVPACHLDLLSCDIPWGAKSFVYWPRSGGLAMGNSPFGMGGLTDVRRLANG
jgi:hypothetical protein